MVVRSIFILFKYVKYTINFDCGLLGNDSSLVGSYRHVAGSHSAVETEAAYSA